MNKHHFGCMYYHSKYNYHMPATVRLVYEVSPELIVKFRTDIESQPATLVPTHV